MRGCEPTPVAGRAASVQDHCPSRSGPDVGAYVLENMSQFI
jgi:hypothetical protein